MAYFFLTIFYLIGILAIIWEFIGITSPVRIHKVFNKIRQISKTDGGFDELPTNYKTLSFMLIGYFIWTILGLFTNNWPIFLFLLILGVIPKRYMIHRWIDGLISLVLILFAMINAFHLHLDLTRLFI